MNRRQLILSALAASILGVPKAQAASLVRASTTPAADGWSHVRLMLPLSYPLILKKDGDVLHIATLPPGGEYKSVAISYGAMLDGSPAYVLDFLYRGDVVLPA